MAARCAALQLCAAFLLCAGAIAVAGAPVPAVPCTDAGECTDNEGTVWDLSMLGRVHRVGGTYMAGSGPRPDTFTYAFRLYANLGVVPDICTSSGVETASAMRYDTVQRFPGGPPPSCEQIGPDMTAAANPSYTVRRVPMGLTFSYQFAGEIAVEIRLRCLEGAGVGQASDALWNGFNRPDVYTINWLNGITCPGVNPPCTAAGACTDDEGTVWQLARLQQIQRIAGPIAGMTYAFRLFLNLNVVPETCSAAGLTTASFMRYTRGGGTGGECAQIGPDMAFDPAYVVRKVPDGLSFVYQFGDSTVNLNLICREVRDLHPRPHNIVRHRGCYGCVCCHCCACLYACANVLPACLRVLPVCILPPAVPVHVPCRCLSVYVMS